MKRNQMLLLFILMIVAGQATAADFTGFKFTALGGKVYDSTELVGTPLVINIGSHWWNKCKTEAPELQRAYLAYKKKGVLFLGVFTMSKEKDVKKFSQEFGITYPVGLEAGIADDLGAKGIPETYFIDKSGRISRKIAGTVHYQELATGIEAMLAADGPQTEAKPE